MRRLIVAAVFVMIASLTVAQAEPKHPSNWNAMTATQQAAYVASWNAADATQRAAWTKCVDTNGAMWYNDTYRCTSPEQVKQALAQKQASDIHPANWSRLSAVEQAAWMKCYGALTRAADARTCDGPAQSKQAPQALAQKQA